MISQFSKRVGSNPKSFINYAKKKQVGISTGIGALDKKLLGLRGLVGVLGEPKSCKSTLVLQIAAHNALQGNPVYILDKENGIHRLTQRLMCQLWKKCWTRLKGASEEQMAKMLSKLNELPIFITNDRITFEDLAEEIGDLAKAYPDKEIILVADSLQALSHKSENMRLSVDEWLINLDALKLKYEGKLTVILTSEKRRGSYGEATKDGGKESGRIEYKLEQQLDMRLDSKRNMIILECTLNRDGPADIVIELDKVFETEDPTSFIFKLQEREVLTV